MVEEKQGFWEKVLGTRKSGVAGNASSSILMGMHSSDGVAAPVDLDDYAIATTNVSWLHRCIHLKASNAAMIRPRVYAKGTDDELTSGPMYDLFQRVNNGDTWYSFAYRSFYDLTYAGEICWELARTAGDVTGITTINPRRIEPVPSRDGINTIIVNADGKDIRIPKGSFVYYYRYNPTNPVRGLSVIQTISNTIASDWNLQLRMKELLANGAIPAGILSFPDALGKNQSKQIRDEWAKLHGKASKAGRTAVLSGGAKYERMSLSPAELQVLDLRKFSREEIASACGVPAFMVGSSDSVNYNNAQEQRAAFWHETMLPELDGEFYGMINESLVPLVEEGVEVRPDLTRIQQLVTTEAARTENATKGFQRGVLTRNEARKAMGVEPLPDGAVLLDPLNSRLVDTSGNVVYDPTGLSLADAPEHETKAVEEVLLQEETLKDVIPDGVKNAAFNAFMKDKNRKAEVLGRLIRKELTKRRKKILEGIRDADGVPKINLNPKIDGQTLFKALAPTVAGFILDAVQDVGRRVNGEKSAKDSVLGIVDFDLADPEVIRFLQQYLLEQTIGLTESQLHHLQAELAGELAEGKIDPGRLEKILEAADISFSMVSSRRAALTWSGAAINKGHLEGGKKFDLPFKVWVSQRVGVPRDWHIALESVGKIPSAQAWTTHIPTKGGVITGKLDFPNDPSGLPKDIYNCHCTFIFADEFTDLGDKSAKIDNYYRSFTDEEEATNSTHSEDE